MENRNPPALMGLAVAGSKTRPPIDEMLSQKGAMALAKRLEQFWHAKGYHAARFWAEPIGERFDKVGTYEIYRVVCNLVNGLPPRYAKTPIPFPETSFNELNGSTADL